MARKDNNEKVESALIVEPGASGNPHLKKMIQMLQKGFSLHRGNKQNHSLDLREHNIALIPNPRPIYAWVKDKKTGERIRPQELFRAGWYVSVAEKALIDEILADPHNKDLNEQIWKTIEDAGLPLDKESGSMKDVKVI